MKKFLLVFAMVALMVCALAISTSAVTPQKPTLDVDFGEVTTIEGFVAPSDLFSTSERVLLTDGEGGYVTYPTYYVTKNSTTFDFDFSKLNASQDVQYTKKSVVMVEIPAGITAISNSYFAGTGNFPLCVSVQFPGTVTSYGSSLFAGANTVIRVVEFLDGTEPITMGDGMFGSNWSAGTTNLQYVKFPNNLVSIGNNTFGKSHANKTIILGANLESIGTNFFSESTPSNKDTHIYVSNKFFANTEMFQKLFGGFDQYHNNFLKLTIFYSGTLEEAQAFVEAGKAVQSGYVFDKVTYVSAAAYDYEAHKPTANASLVMVYDNSACDAFYGGHSFTGTDNVVVDSYFDEIRIGDSCQNCGDVIVKSTIDALFVSKGISAKTFGSDIGLVQGYEVNRAAIEAYRAYVPDFDFGILAYANVEGGAAQPKPGDDKVVDIVFDNEANGYIEVKVTGIPADFYGTPVVFCIYATEGDKFYYLDNGNTTETIVGSSYNEYVG